MKILQLGKFYPVGGGVEKVMYDLTVGLSQQGIRCDMMCTVAGKRKIISLNENGRIYGCKSFVKLAATTLSASMIFELKKICAQYDIIHIHHPDPMAALALYYSGYKGKVILHWHSDILKQKKLLLFYLPLQNWLIKRADLILGTTPVYVKESPYLKDVQQKVNFLPIGVEQLLPPAKEVGMIRSQHPGKKIIFSLGRLIEYKGYKFLIEAASYLDDNFIILIGGDGPLKNDLQQYISQQGLTSKVILLGYIPDELKAAYFGACDVFCISSVQKTEAFGIVQIEAMSCGKPVVATNIPGSGVSWVNKHKESGINCAPQKSKELAEAILAICHDEKTYTGFSDRAKARYTQLFTIRDSIKNVTKLYEQLLKINI